MVIISELLQNLILQNKIDMWQVPEYLTIPEQIAETFSTK